MELLERVKNHSFAAVRCVPAIDDQGFDAAVLVAKLCYHVDASGCLTWTAPSFRFDEVADEHGGIRYPTDFAESKPGLDIGLVGKAYPRQVGATQSLVWLQVGGALKKVCQVFGPRSYVAKGNGITTSAAGKLEPTWLSHGLAWGGTDGSEGDRPHEPRNPVGRGFAKDPRSLIGTPAHAIEPAQGMSTSDLGSAAAAALSTDPMQAGASHPSHAPFAPLGSWWEPRRSRQGTYDSKWQSERAPVRPVDFDPLHNCWGAPDQHLAKPIAVDEAIEVGGATPEGIWRFKLPKYGISLASKLPDETKFLETHLDSLLIDAEERLVELSYRLCMRLPRKWERMPQIIVYGVGDLPDSIFAGPTRKTSGSAAVREQGATS